MAVRGVRFSGETVSYRPIHFSWKDGAICVSMAAIAGAVFTLEKGWGPVIELQNVLLLLCKQP